MHESVKPLPPLNRELKEKKILPKGMVTRGDWERKIFREKFKKNK